MTIKAPINKSLLKILIVSICTCQFLTNTALANGFSPTLGEQSGFSLNSVNSPTNSTLAMYNYNSSSGLIDSINYEINIKNASYGEGSESKSYSINLFNDFKTDFTAQYSQDDLQSHIYVKQKDYSNTDYSGSYVELKKPIVWGAYAFGGAITNLMGKMGDVSGIFIGNSSTTDKKQAWAGAILARGEMNDIKADFIGNYAYSSVTESSGGTIAVAQYNVNSIIGDFIGNYAQGELTSGGYGGAIYVVNNSVVGTVKGNFIGNSARSNTAGAYGGAIEVYRNGKITTIVGDFIGNYADGYREATGGAIELYGTTDSITGDFIANHATSENGKAAGGAVSNFGNISGKINGNFISNYTNGYNNSLGGAIRTEAGFKEITGDFHGNYTVSSDGSALGGAIYSTGEITKLDGDFYSNYTEAKEGNALGGAIYSEGAIFNEITSSFYGNHVSSENGEAKGGAIWTNNDMNFVADNKVIAFVDNYIENNGVKEDNAVYVDNEDATITFNLKNDGKLLIKDNFYGKLGYNVNIIGEISNHVSLLNDLKNADLTLNNITLNTIDNEAHTYNLNSLSLENTVSFIPEVDFEKNEMDRFSTNEDYKFGENSFLQIKGLSFLNELKKDKTSILFAENGLKDKVQYSGVKK